MERIMIKIIRKEGMGRSDLGWLKSRFHFSFAEYYNPDNLNFGVLRVVNDDLVEAGRGFDTHPHRDMEIISYVVDGDLTHKDSMGNQRSLSRGMVQYMSAGSGVFHSEYNLGKDISRFLQLWIMPEKKGLEPNYGDFAFPWEDRIGKWLHMVSHVDGDAPVKVHQDVNIFVIWLEEGDEVDIPVNIGRQGYLIEIEGKARLGNDTLGHGDAAEITGTGPRLMAVEESHVLLVEMKGK